MSSVTVVTVTYGERHEQLRQMLESVDRLSGGETVAQVVVVDNGSGAKTRKLLGQSPFDVVSTGANLGSAAGFSAGIARALELGADFIWLLDDDNRPEPSALVELLDAAAAYGSRTAFQCMRPSYEPLRRLAAGVSPRDVFGHVNACLGESLRLRLGPTRTDLRSADENPIMPWSVFGGFFAPVEAFAATGLPRRDYFIYADDSEYTSRISQAGWQVRLLPKAVVEDVDEAWWTVAGRRAGVTDAVTPRVSGPEELRRMYYTVRNTVHFERSHRVTNSLEYLVNMAVKHVGMIGVCSLSALKTRSLNPLRNLGIYFIGAWHGLIGRLGHYAPMDRLGEQ